MAKKSNYRGGGEALPPLFDTETRGMESLAKEQMAGLAEEFDNYRWKMDANQVFTSTNPFLNSVDLLDELMDTLKKMESLPSRNIDLIQTVDIEHVDKCILTSTLLEEYEKNPNLDLSNVKIKFRAPGYAREEVEKALDIKRKMEGFADKLSGCSSYEDFSSVLLDLFNYEYPGDPFGWANDRYREYAFRKALLSKLGAKEASGLEEKIRGFIEEEVKRRTQKGIDFIESIPEAGSIKEYMGKDIYGDCKAGGDYQRRQEAKKIEVLKKPCMQDFNRQPKLYAAIMNFLPSLRKKMLEQSSVSEKEAEAWFKKNVSIQCPARARAKREEVAENVKLFYRLTGGKLPDKMLKIQVGGTKRAYAKPEHGLIVLAEDSSPATIMHELGHVLDVNNLNQNLLPRFFIKERATGAPQKLLKLVKNSNYKKSEIAYPDTFNDPYVGKIYPESASEVVSMFFTFLFLDTATERFNLPMMAIMLDLNHSGLVMDLILDKNPPTTAKGYNGERIKTMLAPYMPEKAIQKISEALSNHFYDLGNSYNNNSAFYSILGFAPASTSVGERMILDVVNDRIFMGSCGTGTAEITVLLIYMYSIGCREFPFKPSKMRTIAKAAVKRTPPDWFVDWCYKINEDTFLQAFEKNTVGNIKKKNSARPQLYKTE